MKTITKDFTIIGGGPGGYVAGPIAAAAGLSVACVEKEVLGGVCLKWGCMPTKSLAAVSQCMDKFREAGKFGIRVGEYSLDFEAVMQRMKNHVATLEAGCVSKFAKSGIDLFMGTGSLVDPHMVLVTPKDGEPFLIASKNILIDTGSTSANVPPFPYGDPGILTNKEILSLDTIPKDLMIVGGGVMGCEFANIFANLGSRVTIVELLPRLLSTVDKDIAMVIEQDFRERGIEMFFETKVESCVRNENGFTCTLSSEATLHPEKILVVVGRKPCSSNIGLESAGIKTDKRGCIAVDEYLGTTASSVCAIGDVIGGTFAHVSRMEGEVVVANILGRRKAMDYTVVPWAIFTSLEIAGVGLTEQDALKQEIPYDMAIAPFKSNGKAMVSDEGKGFVKTIVHRDSRKILGTQIVGPHASDLIHEMALAIKVGATAEDVSGMIHVHPTLAEAVLKTVQQLSL